MWQNACITVALVSNNILFGMSYDNQCRIINAGQPREGSRCATDASVYINIASSLQHICVYSCATRSDCVFVNYDILNEICYLSNTPCYEYVPDEDFEVTYLMPEPPICIKWVPYTRYASSNVMTANPCNVVSAYATCAVGRAVLSTDKLLGKYHDNVHKLWYVLGDDVIEKTDDLEILDVQEGCHVAWVPYSSGNTLPARAVVGGYISGGGSADTDLYVIRGRALDYTVIGYYNPKTLRGHIGYDGPQELTDMEMLTVV